MTASPAPARRKIIRGIAAFDFAVTAPFALPYVGETMIRLVYHLDTVFGFATVPHGFAAAPVGFGSAQMMFVHIMGVLGVVWALARFRMPNEMLARMDGLARVMVAALILHAINLGAPRILVVFILTELAGSVAQLLGRREG